MPIPPLLLYNVFFPFPLCFDRNEDVGCETLKLEWNTTSCQPHTAETKIVKRHKVFE